MGQLSHAKFGLSQLRGVGVGPQIKKIVKFAVSCLTGTTLYTNQGQIWHGM